MDEKDREEGMLGEEETQGPAAEDAPQGDETTGPVAIPSRMISRM